MRGEANLLNRIKLMLAVQSPLAKIFSFPSDPNHPHISHRSDPMEGRIAIVTDAGRDAVDAGCALDEGAGLRTAKSCGPDASTLASSWWRRLRWRR
jgi:hypothetical protein